MVDLGVVNGGEGEYDEKTSYACMKFLKIKNRF